MIEYSLLFYNLSYILFFVFCLHPSQNICPLKKLQTFHSIFTRFLLIHFLLFFHFLPIFLLLIVFFYFLSLGWFPNKHLNKKKDKYIKEINNTSTTTTLIKDFYFIWASERSGYRQLYLYLYRSTDNHENENENIVVNKNGFLNLNSNSNSNSNKDNLNNVNKSVVSAAVTLSAVCCNNGVPIGGGGPWIVDR